MKLEKIKAIAAVRTPGPWSVVGPDHNKMVRTKNGKGYGIAAGNADCAFIAMAANTYDKLLAAAEALKKSKEIYDLEMTFETAMAFKKCMEEDVTNALAELERE